MSRGGRLRLIVICVGGLKETYWKDAVAHYSDRLAPACDLAILEIPEEPLKDAPSPAEIEAALRKEGERLRKKIPAGAWLAALDIRGRSLREEALAKAIKKAAFDEGRPIAFLIGGSHGLAPEVLAAADLRLSFSPMTFPHQMMRVILLAHLCRTLSD